jgi:hypothetical protein
MEFKMLSSVFDLKFAVLETGDSAIFCLGNDGTLEVMDYSSSYKGKSLLPKRLKPKNECSPLHFALLDTEGSVLPALSEKIELAWADNSSLERPRTVGMTKLSNFSHGRGPWRFYGRL